MFEIIRGVFAIIGFVAVCFALGCFVEWFNRVFSNKAENRRIDDISERVGNLNLRLISLDTKLWSLDSRLTSLEKAAIKKPE